MQRVLFGLLASLLLLPTWSLHAQTELEVCNPAATDSNYGALSVGTEVVLARHRIVAARDNWDPSMSGFLGRVAHITRLSGRDSQGCLGVRVDIDHEAHFWRARDLRIGTSPQPIANSARAEGEQMPQACNGSPNFGALRVGASVTLGRPRSGNGSNWSPQMDSFVGRTARVIELAGVDGDGCSGVRVDIDEGSFFWRVRDLASGGLSAAMANAMGPSGGVETDHGRPMVAPSEVVSIFGNGAALPDTCGLTDQTANFGPLATGSQVLLGRHRVVDGQDNWDAAMDPFVGRTATVTRTIGVDDQGCPVVYVDVDGGAHFWRIRDMQVAAGTTAQNGQSLSLAPGFAPNPFIARGQVGGTVEAETIRQGCNGWVSRLPNFTVTVRGSLGNLRFLVASDVDTTLMIQDPHGQFFCIDDVEGLNPVIERASQPGVYRVWVGAYSQDAAGSPFRLGITTRADVTTQSF